MGPELADFTARKAEAFAEKTHKKTPTKVKESVGTLKVEEPVNNKQRHDSTTVISGTDDGDSDDTEAVVRGETTDDEEAKEPNEPKKKKLDDSRGERYIPLHKIKQFNIKGQKNNTNITLVLLCLWASYL